MHAALSFRPELTTFEWPQLEDLRTAPVRQAVAHWQAARGARLFPPRSALRPRDIAAILPHLALLKVIDGGADLEHRIVGDAHVRVYRVPLQNRRFSEIARDAPILVAVSMPMYVRVVQSRAPLAWRVRTGYDAVDVAFNEAEGVMLPLGETDDAVDHVAAFCTYKLAASTDAGLQCLTQS